MIIDLTIRRQNGTVIAQLDDLYVRLGSKIYPKSIEMSLELSCLGEKRTITATPRAAFGPFGEANLGISATETVLFDTVFKGWRDPPPNVLPDYVSEADEDTLLNMTRQRIERSNGIGGGKTESNMPKDDNEDEVAQERLRIRNFVEDLAPQRPNARDEL